MPTAAGPSSSRCGSSGRRSRERPDVARRPGGADLRRGMREVAPAIARAGGGAIVNLSSVEGLGGNRFLVAYTGSKFAVRGMTKAAAIELAAKGIRVNSVHPGGIDTPMVQHFVPDAADR